jgi:3',5'-cyclic AMP phosphodiesterase CpdA
MMLIAIILSLFFPFPELDSNNESDSTRIFNIAFLADVHLHNIFITKDLADGLPLPVLGQNNQQILARTLEAQLRSTRLFNENYFAFIQALDNMVEQNIRFVILNGDFTDDGQPINISLIKTILTKYSTEHKMRFFLSPGNHDPGKPVSNPAGKPDFLDTNGLPIGIFSPDHTQCQNIKDESDTTFCKDFIREYGYTEIFNELSEFGFLPTSGDLYYETPFSGKNYVGSTFEEMIDENQLENRTFMSCPPELDTRLQNNLISPNCFEVPDLSYLVEPISGLWLVSIDANVYNPRIVDSLEYTHRSSDSTMSPNWFDGSGNAGFNSVVTQKPYLLDWIKSINARAKGLNKTVVFFSHYPAVAFYNGAETSMSSLFGSDTHQLSRSPSSETSKILASTGMRLHFGGHMHMNDTGIYTDSTDALLVNIQVPSIAAYPPAYKIARFSEDQKVTIETHKLSEVNGFDTLFPLYKITPYSKTPGDSTNFILDAKTYWEFAQKHLENLVLLRFIPDDWTPLMIQELDSSIEEQNLPFNRNDIIQDFYKLRNGGSISHEDIPVERLQLYRVLSLKYSEELLYDDNSYTFFENLVHIIRYYLEIHPDDEFTVDLSSGDVHPLKQKD